MLILYGIVGIIVFVVSLFLSMGIGEAIGPGANEIGFVIVSLSLLKAIIVVCTLYLANAIKESKETK